MKTNTERFVFGDYEVLIVTDPLRKNIYVTYLPEQNIIHSSKAHVEASDVVIIKQAGIIISEHQNKTSKKLTLWQRLKKLLSL